MLSEQTTVETISITPNAARVIKDLLEKRQLNGYALRVFISGGGCSGYQYGMALEEKPREQDLLVEENGVKVVVDDYSIEYLRGAKIDYSDTESGAGFVINSPIPLPSCGCGTPSQSSGCSSCQ